MRSLQMRLKGDSEKCIEAGMNDYISKPFNKEELMQKIVALIEPDDQMTTEASKPS